MQRREALEASGEGRKPRRLSELDYLLGVFDEARMGALRFSLKDDGNYLSNNKSYATPPWLQLRALEAASIGFETEEGRLSEDWLNLLLAPGSSLGGTRPKASVQAPGGTLWIAKFPSRHDDYNSGAWEKVVHELARLCLLDVPSSKLETFSDFGSTFLVKRFDRDGKRRIHFSSAMSFLSKEDGVAAGDGASYLDIAEFIRSYGSSPKNDLKELWRRIVFSMAVSNTDDHLRNHGFILASDGWRLSPLFDVNPVPYGKGLSLNVSQFDNQIDLNLALEVASYFLMDKLKAEESLVKIIDLVAENWVRLAKSCGLSSQAIDYMSPAFSLRY